MIYSRNLLALICLFSGVSLAPRFAANASSILLNRNYTRIRRDVEVRSFSFTKEQVFDVFNEAIVCDKDKEKEERQRRQNCVTACTIDLRQMDLQQPLIMYACNKQKLYMPEEFKISLAPDDELFLSCTVKRKLTLKIDKHKTTLGYSSTLVRCMEENKFAIITNGEIKDIFSFFDLKCEEAYDYEVQISDTSPLVTPSGEYSLFRVGFPVDETVFVPTYGGWTDLKTGKTAYVRSVIQKNPFKEQMDRDDTWTELPSKFYVNNLQINSWFNTQNQKKSLDIQYGCDGVDNTGNCAYHVFPERLYNRGHLTPKSSFMYKIARLSTFTLPNASPQVIHINNRNWVNVEDQAQYLAKNARGAKALQVITGTYGKVRIGDEKYLHLHATESELAMQIPLYFWKLIYQAPGSPGRQTAKGIVFVTLNKIPVEENPIMSAYHELCDNPITDFMSKDPLHKIGGVVSDFNSDNAADGYTYACSVKEFLDKAQDLPDMESLRQLESTINTRVSNDKSLGLLTNPKKPIQFQKNAPK